MRAGAAVLLWASANRDAAESPATRSPSGSGAIAASPPVSACTAAPARTGLWTFRVMIDEIPRPAGGVGTALEEVPRSAGAGRVYAPTSLPVRFTPGLRKPPAVPVP